MIIKNKKTNTMKNLLTTCILLITVLITNAQNCDGFFPLTEGTTFQHTSYNKKDKLVSISDHKITSSQSITNGTQATLELSITDDKNEQSNKFNYIVECKNGKFYIDTKYLYSVLTSNYNGMDITFEDGISTVPNNIKVGDKLEDVMMKINVKSSGTNIITMTISITDRLVKAKESKTTPAGTYDCFVLTQNSTIKMGSMITVKNSSKNWIAKGFGSVRSENYNKKGNLEDYSVLTKFKK